MGAKISKIVEAVPPNQNSLFALVLNTVTAVLTNKKIPTGKITKEQAASMASTLEKIAKELEQGGAGAGAASAVPGTSATPATSSPVKNAEGKTVATVVKAGTPGTRTPEQEKARQEELQQTETVTKGAEAKPGGTGTLVGGSRKRKGKHRSKHRSSKVPK